MKQTEKVERLAWILACGTRYMQLTGCKLRRAMVTAEALHRQLGHNRPAPRDAAASAARTLAVAIAYKVAA